MPTALTLEVDRFCPNCRNTVGQQYFCPRCGEVTHPVRENDDRPLARHMPSRLTALPWRLVAGVVIGTIIVHIVSLLTGAAVAAWPRSGLDQSPASLWITGIAITLCAFAASVIASAGDSQGGLCGGLVAAGILAVEIGRRAVAQQPDVDLLSNAVPPALVMGFLGGTWGGYHWRALRPSKQFQPPKRIAEEHLVTAVPIAETVEDHSEPLPISRFGLMAVGAFALLWENRRIARVTGEVLFPGINLDMYSWILQALTVVAAVWVVSELRKRSIRNGLIAGVMLAAMLIGIHAVHDPTPPVTSVYREITGRTLDPVNGIVVSAVGAVALAALTGWIAGQIRPPAEKPRSGPATA